MGFSVRVKWVEYVFSEALGVDVGAGVIVGAAVGWELGVGVDEGDVVGVGVVIPEGGVPLMKRYPAGRFVMATDLPLAGSNGGQVRLPNQDGLAVR